MKDSMKICLFFYIFLFNRHCQSSGRSRQKIMISYSDLEKAGLQCYPGDLCFPERYDMDINRVNDQICFCDSLCSMYNDCCLDARPKKTYKLESTCINVGQQYFYMVNKCPRQKIHDQLKELCEQNMNNMEDPLSGIPVTSMESNITYKNIFCLRCNEDINFNQIYMWLVSLKCILNQAIKQKENMKELDIIKRLTFDVKKGKWIPNMTGDPLFTGDCFQEINDPFEIRELIHHCEENTIQECDPSWNNQDFRKKCKSYTAYVSNMYNTYKNIHCALCNHITLDNIKCGGKTPFLASGVGTDFSRLSLSILFDSNYADGNQLVGRKSCPDRQIYDPYSRVCRSVGCGRFERYHNGQCISL